MNAKHPCNGRVGEETERKKIKPIASRSKKRLCAINGGIPLGLSTLKLKDLLCQNVRSDDIGGSDKRLC